MVARAGEIGGVGVGAGEVRREFEGDASGGRIEGDCDDSAVRRGCQGGWRGRDGDDASGVGVGQLPDVGLDGAEDGLVDEQLRGGAGFVERGDWGEAFGDAPQGFIHKQVARLHVVEGVVIHGVGASRG